MDVLFWSELLVVQVSISIERPASTQNVRPMIGRPADVQIWSFNGSCKIGTRWTTAGYITNRSPVKWQKLDVHRMSVAYNKWTNGKWTIGYPMDVLWIMCASREAARSPPTGNGMVFPTSGSIIRQKSVGIRSLESWDRLVICCW
jgi:hypothetical protein